MQTDIHQRLEQVFEPQQAAVLAEVIAATSGVAAISGEIAALTSAVGGLAEAQRRTEERVDTLVQTIEGLAEAQRRTEDRLGGLAEAQRRTEDRLGALAEAQRRTEERMDTLADAMGRLAQAQARNAEQLGLIDVTLTRAQDKLGRLDGRVLELTYREKAGAYFGPLLRRMRLVLPHTLEDALEAQVSPEDFQDVLRLDLLVSGRPRRPRIDAEVLLAVEISVAIDEHDVVRARRRASILRRAGYQAVPVVAGEHLTAGAEGEARQQPVVVLLDGHALHWDEALADLVGPAA
ncbi:MAG: hypothetical protein HY332_03590 [Chloroflexi bacterium]|nr:hypothetical protein [Chloroflexota bacterium]